MKCSRCDGRAVAYLPYSKMNLCKKHFLLNFEKRFLRTVRDYKLVEKGGKIAVGVSGGKDSIALLHLMKMLNKKMPFELFAITVDEGIRDYRNILVDVAQEECKKLGVRQVVLSFEKDLGISMDEIMKTKRVEEACSYCGVMRRNLLNKAAREEKADKIAIGHNLDDVGQTVFMNFMRNEPLRLARFGVAGGIVEDEDFVQRIKPLLRSPEKESAIYCILKGIPIQNRGCPYAKGALRSHVRGMLNEAEQKYPGTKYKILNSFLEFKKMIGEDAAKRALTLEKCVKCGEPSSSNECMCCKMLGELGVGR